MAENGTFNVEGEEIGIFNLPIWVYGLMTSVYVSVFLLGIAGNILVIFVVVKDGKMRTTANFYLISLSFADLMIIIFCLPVAVYELNAEEVWDLGPILCKLAPFLQYLSTNASISTMVAISIERYYVVCKPLKIRTYCTKGRATGVILILWLFSFVCSSPLLHFTQHEWHFHNQFQNSVHVCYINYDKNEIYFYFHQLCFYILPGILLSLIYSRIVWTLRDELKNHNNNRFSRKWPGSRKNCRSGSKSQSDTRQLIFMLSIVVISYFVCLLPYNCITFLSLISNQTLLNLGPIEYNVFLAFSRIMFFVNSCINPITYNVISRKFRKSFKQSFCPSRRDKTKGIGTGAIVIRSERGNGVEEGELLESKVKLGNMRYGNTKAATL